MAVLEEIDDHHYAMWCPGCTTLHSVTVNGYKNSQGAGWQWNNSMDCPTFHPSILVRWSYGPNHIEKRCHSFIKNGKWEFLKDCTHELAGQTVDMEDVPE